MGQGRSPSVSPSRQAASSTGSAQEEPSLFQMFLLEGNPFERHIEHKEEETEDVLASNGVSVCQRGSSEMVALRVWTHKQRMTLASAGVDFLHQNASVSFFLFVCNNMSLLKLREEIPGNLIQKCYCIFFQAQHQKQYCAL